jgi:hypothetical protein
MMGFVCVYVHADASPSSSTFRHYHIDMSYDSLRLEIRHRCRFIFGHLFTSLLFMYLYTTQKRIAVTFTLSESWTSIYTSLNSCYFIRSGHAVAQLVKALRYKTVGRGFDCRWCHWNFSLTKFFRSYYGPWDDSASKRNDYQEHFLWGNFSRTLLHGVSN